jgi:hypothetical protein
MLLSDFAFDLPEELIAQQRLPNARIRECCWSTGLGVGNSTPSFPSFPES